MTSLRGVDSMHRVVAGSSCPSTFDQPQHYNEDSGLGDSCSSGSSCDSTTAAAGPTEFAAINVAGSGVTQKLSREMASMHIIRKGKKKGGDFGCKTDRDEEEEERMEGVLFEEDDENARDCDSSFTMMPPPALPVGPRRALGDIRNRSISSPVSSKNCRFSRNETMPMISASNSTGGLRNRKRERNCSPRASPFSAMMGKRWRVAESIDEHSETASTSYASRTHSQDSRGGDDKPVTGFGPGSRTFHRVQSTSVLEMGHGHHHHDQNLPTPLEVKYALPSALEQPDSDVYRRICAHTLSRLMREMGEEFEKSYALIDCRYPYEYEGGHIKGATNVYDPQLIDARFFSASTSLLSASEGGEKEEKENEEEKEKGEAEQRRRRIPIFYCEFSQKRGPSMALAVRALDRLRNTWPVVDHAEMYVLNGGYKGFHEDATKHGFGELCAPFAYVRMEAPEHKAAMDRFRFHKSRNLLSFTSTVSRLPQPSVAEARRERQAAQASPISIARRASRRALVFSEDSSSGGVGCSSPARPSPTGPLPNPQFS